MSKRTDRIFAEICSHIKLTSKEKQLFKYFLDLAASKNRKNTTIEETCKALHTTVRTYFRTFTSLKEKKLTP